MKWFLIKLYLRPKIARYHQLVDLGFVRDLSGPERDEKQRLVNAIEKWVDH